MPTENARKHTIPTGTEQPSRAAIFEPLTTIHDLVPASSATDRNFIAAGLSPTSTKPLHVYRTDTGIVETTTNGTTWVPMTPGSTVIDGVTYAQPRTDGLIAQLTIPSAPYRRVVRLESHGALLNNSAGDQYDANIIYEAAVIRTGRYTGALINFDQQVSRYLAAGASAYAQTQIVRVGGGSANYQHQAGTGFNASRLELTAVVSPAP